MRRQYQAVNGFLQKLFPWKTIRQYFLQKNIASHFPSTRSEHFLFFFFFFWKIFSGAKFFKPKLCLHTKFALTQCTVQPRKRLFTSFPEEETQENQCSNPARTATSFTLPIRKNSKPTIGHFTPFGSMAFSTRTFAARSSKCFASATLKPWCGISSSQPLKSPAEPPK